MQRQNKGTIWNYKVHFLPFDPTDKRTGLTYIDGAGKVHRLSKGAREQRHSQVQVQVNRNSSNVSIRYTSYFYKDYCIIRGVQDVGTSYIF
nr:hypothetical protein [Tanacetum cinerariifolium]